jgi:hypothetical protein
MRPLGDCVTGPFRVAMYAAAIVFQISHGDLAVSLSTDGLGDRKSNVYVENNEEYFYPYIGIWEGCESRSM